MFHFINYIYKDTNLHKHLKLFVNSECGKYKICQFYIFKNIKNIKNINQPNLFHSLNIIKRPSYFILLYLCILYVFCTFLHLQVCHREGFITLYLRLTVNELFLRVIMQKDGLCKSLLRCLS